MNKNVKNVMDLLVAKKANIQGKLKGSISEEVKKSLETALAEIETGIADLEALETEATIEDVTAVFTKAMETLVNAGTATEAEVASLKASMEANLQKLQSQIVKSAEKKKMSAKLQLAKIKKESKTDFVPFHAGVDLTLWTPEAEIDNVEAYHPLIGVVGGFTISTTSKPTVKVRGLSATGTATVVANHAPKPLIEFVGSQGKVNAETIAGVVDGIADEDLEDNPELELEITNEALEALAQAENVSAVALLEASAEEFDAEGFGTVAYADEKTAIIAVVNQVKKALGKRTSDISFVANSTTWAKLKDLRNVNGTPISLDSILGEINAIEDNTLTGDNFYCFAKKFANFKVYKTAKDEWYKGVKTVLDANKAITAVYSEWRTDESSLRVRERVLMYIADTNTVVKGSISAVLAEITPEPAPNPAP